jgi:hypothetical protein
VTTPPDENLERIALEHAGKTLMLRLREAFPHFEETWAAHVAYWGVEPAGAFLDISEFAHFVDKKLFHVGKLEEIRRALLLLEGLFLKGDKATRDLIGIGFVEDLQTILSGRVDGYNKVIPLLPPTLLKVWKQIEKQWAGHNSLMEVIRAEATQSQQSTWSQLLNLSNGEE